MSSILICPACDKPVTLSTYEHAYTVCACRNVLRYNGQVQLAHLMAIPQFPELIQPGTTGKWKNENFTVSGRIQIQFQESFMNFWDLRTDKSDGLLLMEGYGLYAILAKGPNNFGHDYRIKYKPLEVGKHLKWEHNDFLLEEDNSIKDVNFEGEIRLPPVVAKGSLLSFASPSGINHLVIEWTPDNPETYILTATGFDELELGNLREPQPSTKQFFCQVCNTALPVTLFPYVNSVVCKSCNVQHSWKQQHGFVKRKGTDYRLNPTIPVGAKGVIKHIPYTVTGYTEKEETKSPNTFWREYTLHNPQYGFAYLSEYNGHWIYLKQELDAPVLLDPRSDSFELKNENFVKYNAYWAKVRAAEGEFPYDIFNDSSNDIKEFISPPEMWGREMEGQTSLSWFYGQHISGHEVQSAFALKEMPARSGIGAVQPTGYMSQYKLFVTWILGVGLLLLVHSIIMLARHDRVLLRTDHFYMDTTTQQNIVTPKFELDRNLSNIEIDINAPVSNSWFELEATLVNTVTGAEFSQEKGVEYYSGYSDGESWKEGSTNAQIWFNAVPKGTYLLQMRGIRPPAVDAVNYFSVQAKYDVPSHRNFWWITFFWSLFVLIAAIIQKNIEARRWDPAGFVAENGKSLRYEN